MAIAGHQKIMTTSNVPRSHAVISRFDQMWSTAHQEQSSWTTLITRLSSFTYSPWHSENFTSLWSRVTWVTCCQVITQWFWLVLQSSNTFTMDQVLLWVSLDTICSHARRRLGSSNQRLYLQQRVQRHNIPSVPTYRPGTGSSYRACLWTPVTMDGH